MKLQDQVCTLPQAKRLKELGVQQDSLFDWVCLMPDPLGEKWFYEIQYKTQEPETLQELIASAFTVAELGGMLPRNFASFNCGYDIWRVANTFTYASGHGEDKIGKLFTGELKTYSWFHGENEAQSRAAMLIHLLENKII